MMGFFRHEKGGNFAITFALAAGPLLMAGTLAVDATAMLREKQTMQNALDAALLAIGAELESGMTEAELGTLGLNVLSANLPGDVEGLDFRYLGEPTEAEAAAYGIAPSRAAEFRLATAAFDFTGSFGLYPEQRFAHVAGIVPAETGDFCVLALNENLQRAISITGNTSVEFADCDLVSNSSAEPAIHVGGSGEVKANCLRAVGTIDASGFRTELTCDAVKEGRSPQADPFAGLERPEPGEPYDMTGCGQAVGQGGGSGSCEAGYELNGVLTLKPGTYAGLDVKGRVDLEPGNYIMTGQLHINANADLRGTGVTLFLAAGTQLNINGNAAVDLSAPDTGPYAGMVIVTMEDFAETLKLNGTADARLSGLIYAPDAATVEYMGNGEIVGRCISIVAQSVVFTGNSHIVSTCEPEGEETMAGNPRYRLAL